MAKVAVVEFDEPVKCGSCLWTTRRLFLFEGEEDAGGLCAECFAEMLAEGGYEVFHPEDLREREGE